MMSNRVSIDAAELDDIEDRNASLQARLWRAQKERDELKVRLAAIEVDLRAAIDERDRAQVALAAEREVSDGRQQRITELEGLASLAACAIDIRLTASPAWHDLATLDEALATVSREAKALLGADPFVDARDQPELMRRSEVKA
jgi:chromosome segregation ATPase